MTHTPGPWEAVCIEGIGWAVFGLRGEDGERCPIYGTLGNVGAANAYLIAAVTDLLAACEMTLAHSLMDDGFNSRYCRFCGAYVYDDHQGHFTDCPVPSLRAAVIKAKGT